MRGLLPAPSPDSCPSTPNASGSQSPQVIVSAGMWGQQREYGVGFGRTKGIRALDKSHWAREGPGTPC